MHIWSGIINIVKCIILHCSEHGQAKTSVIPSYDVVWGS